MAVLYRKYRPQNFDEMVGQENIVDALKRSVAADKSPHALLFVGPKGSGKTTTARIFAKAINCPNVKEGNPCGVCDVCEEIASGASVDVIEIDGASNRKIDDIREIRDKISHSPSKFKKKVYIIDEVHMLTKEAFNALLKTLEEPPSHAVFVLCTTESDKLPATIISRCQRFDFNLGKDDEIKKYLGEILTKEKVDYDDEAIAVVAGYAGGSFRDALSMAGQVAVFEKVTLATIENILGRAGENYAKKFVTALLESDKKSALEVVSDLEEKGLDALEFVRLTLIETKQLLMEKISIPSKSQYTKEDLVNIYNSLDKCFQRLKYSPVAELPILVAIMEFVGVKDNALEKEPTSNPSQKIEKTKILKKTEKVEKNEENLKAKNIELSKEKVQRANIPEDEKIVVEDSAQELMGSDQLQTIYNNWKAILENLRPKNTYVTTILRGSKPIAFDGNKVTVEVYFRLHQDKLREAKVLSLIESSMSEVLGKKVFLLITVGKKEITPTSDLSIENLVEAAGEIFGASN